MTVPDRASARRRSPREYTQSVSGVVPDLAKLRGGKWTPEILVAAANAVL